MLRNIRMYDKNAIYCEKGSKQKAAKRFQKTPVNTFLIVNSEIKNNFYKFSFIKSHYCSLLSSGEIRTELRDYFGRDTYSRSGEIKALNPHKQVTLLRRLPLPLLLATFY